MSAFTDLALEEAGAAVCRHIAEKGLTPQAVRAAIAEKRSLISAALAGVDAGVWSLLPPEDKAAILAWGGKELEHVLGIVARRYPQHVMALVQNPAYLASEMAAAKAKLRSLG